MMETPVTDTPEPQTVPFTSILVEQQGLVWRIVLNRPEKKNAHDTLMFKEIVQALDMLEQEPACRCIVITGAGNVFSAGQDLSFTTKATPEQLDEYGRWNVAARERMQRNHKPVVAAINGPAIGGGSYIAMSCDLVVAVDTAYFQMREIEVGNHSGGAAMFTIGRARSLEMTLLGRKIPAGKALEWGMINRVATADEFDAAVDDYAQALAGMPPLAIRYTKASANLLLDMAGYGAHLDGLAPMQQFLMLTPDGKEAKAAFRERRKPNFTGAYPLRPA